MSLNAGVAGHLPFSIPSTQLLAGTGIDLVSPIDGYVVDAFVVVDTAVTTGGTVKVQLGVTPTDVPACVTTVPNSAAKGAVYNSVDPTPGSSGRKVSKGDRIRVLPAGFASAGALNGVILFNSADVSPQEAL